MFTAGPPVSKVSLQWSIYLLVGGQNCAMCFVQVRHFLSFPVTSCRSLSPATVAPPYRYNIGLNRWNSCFINSILIFYNFFFFLHQLNVKCLLIFSLSSHGRVLQQTGRDAGGFDAILLSSVTVVQTWFNLWSFFFPFL